MSRLLPWLLAGLGGALVGAGIVVLGLLVLPGLAGWLAGSGRLVAGPADRRASGVSSAACRTGRPGNRVKTYPEPARIGPR